MANKQEITKTEARILVFLTNVKNGYRFAGVMASKLQVDYGYILRILAQMRMKKWLRVEHYALKKYYFLTRKAPIKKAKELLK